MGEMSASVVSHAPFGGHTQPTPRHVRGNLNDPLLGDVLDVEVMKSKRLKSSKIANFEAEILTLSIPFPILRFVSPPRGREES